MKVLKAILLIIFLILFLALAIDAARCADIYPEVKVWQAVKDKQIFIGMQKLDFVAWAVKNDLVPYSLNSAGIEIIDGKKFMSFTIEGNMTLLFCNNSLIDLQEFLNNDEKKTPAIVKFAESIFGAENAHSFGNGWMWHWKEGTLTVTNSEDFDPPYVSLHLTR